MRTFEEIMEISTSKKNIRLLTKEEIEIEILALNEPKYRANQVYEWIWKKAARSFEEMTNLSKSFREKLDSAFIFASVNEDIVQKSTDGTLKVGFKTFDNQSIEGVIIPDTHRITACVSSQVGCSLSCAFCATGFLKRDRNLEAAEIYDQVVLLNEIAQKHHERGLTNIVYMGMGEPMLNYDNVVESIRKITSETGLHMGAKRITVSTSGVARGIKRLADEGLRVNLALSLHAATNEKRNLIMDINRSNPLEDLVEAMNYFYDKTGNKITFEYILFNQFNDSIADAEDLVQLCKKVPAFVNIIEYNQVEGVTLTKAKREKREAFVAYLEKNHVHCKVRRSRGKDIDAACGQLANKIKENALV